MFEFNMPRKTRTMSMTPFVIACECQANFRQRDFHVLLVRGICVFAASLSVELAKTPRHRQCTQSCCKELNLV
jgi:hypothetical protein